MADSLKQKAYNIIKHKILYCEYPPNMFLNEEILCNEINASRTPIRDAIVRLEQENLVKILPKKGIIVAPLTVGEINAIYETRILLEPYILLNYGPRITAETLTRLTNVMNRMDIDMKDITPEILKEIHSIDDEFHRILISLCNNKYLIQCYDNIYSQNFRLRIMSGAQDSARFENTKNEHMSVYKYIVQENYAKATELLKEHIILSKEAAFKILVDSNFSV